MQRSGVQQGLSMASAAFRRTRIPSRRRSAVFPSASGAHRDNRDWLGVSQRALERRRDRLVAGLRDAGYETALPEGGSI